MSVLIFVIILIALIVVHEWGHFITAKRAGIRVDEFGIGFPPRAFTFYRKDETRYTFNWLPFGGFVKIFGEDPEDVPADHPERNRSLVGKPRYIQALVLFAGVGMNIIAAWLLFAVAFMAGVPTAVDERTAHTVENPALTIIQVLTESPAAEAGLLPGDQIVGVVSERDVLVELAPEEVIAFVGKHEGSAVEVTFNRRSVEQTVSIQPESGLVPGEPERAALGISMGLVGELQLPLHLALYEAGIQTFQYFGAITVAIVSFFANAFTFNADLSQVAGPVGIVSLVRDAATLGWVSLVTFTAVISLHLAVINLLPIPALDGGRLLFVLIEAIKGSPIKASVARMANTVGFVLLILLMLIVTASDISKLLA